MNNDSGSTVSPWMATAAIDVQPMLKMDEIINTDVCVIGAGISGLTVAYFLLESGHSVVVLDDGPIGGGETGRTTAHLSNALDDRYYNLEKLHGRAGAHLAAFSHAAAIDSIERIVLSEDIRCDFERVDGYLFAAPDRPAGELERELLAARRAGLSDVTRLERAPIPGWDTGPCLRFPNQAQLHPLRYLRGLAEAVQRRDGRIFTNTHAVEFHGGKDPHVQTRTGARILCRQIVVATNSPVNDRFVLHGKQAAYRTYVIGALIRRGTMPRVLLWDTADPYHYVRTAPSETSAHDLLIVGGEDHRTGQEDDADGRFEALLRWTRDRFPSVGRVAFRWSGQVMEPVDGLAYIGRNPAGPDNVYVVTGDSGHGMTHGTIAGLLISDLISGRKNPWEKLYAPSRKRLRSAWETAKEWANITAQYTDYLTPGEVKSVAKIEPESGAVVRRGLHKIAMYRDGEGKLHECSAVCSHLGCIVHWNPGEHTWDCPCHGSRFDPYGKVVNGPAARPLARVSEWPRRRRRPHPTPEPSIESLEPVATSPEAAEAAAAAGQRDAEADGSADSPQDDSRLKAV